MASSSMICTGMSAQSAYLASRRLVTKLNTPSRVAARADRCHCSTSCRDAVTSEETPAGGLQSRRAFLSSLALSSSLLLPGTGRAADDAGPPSWVTFESSEGFVFSYPEDWLVAFDRSGSKGVGAIAVVGNFRSYDTVGVFRTDLPADVKQGQGLNVEQATDVFLGPQKAAETTYGFQVLKAAERPGEAGRQYFDFEYEVQTCRGDKQEGLGGKFSCVGPYGNDLPVSSRHYIASATIHKGQAYQITSATLDERFPSVKDTLQRIVDSWHF